MNIDQFMSAIKQMESGGNYKAMGVQTNYGRATGAYQFIDSTWGNYGGYSSAAMAPPAVQDAKARQLMQSYFDYVKSHKPGIADDQAWGVVAMGWMGGRGAMDNWIKHGSSLSYDPYSKMSPDEYSRRVLGFAGRAPQSGNQTPGGDATPGTAGPPQNFSDWVGSTMPDVLDSLANRPAMNTEPTSGV